MYFNSFWLVEQISVDFECGVAFFAKFSLIFGALLVSPLHKLFIPF